MSRSPQLAEVLRAAFTSQLEGVYTSLVGKVVRYDAARQLADVQPVTMEAYEDETGKRVAVALPVCVNCPVQFQTFGSLVIMGPVAVGDTGMLSFSRHSLDSWLASDGSRVLDPGLDHKFNLSDAVFLPGVTPFGRPRKTTPTNALMLGTDGGSFQGAGLGETIKSYLDSLKTWLDGLVVEVNVTDGVTLPPAVSSPAVPTIASATVKVTP